MKEIQLTQSKVAIVDDEDYNLKMLSSLLQKDYNLLLAHDGQEAFEMVKVDPVKKAAPVSLTHSTSAIMPSTPTSTILSIYSSTSGSSAGSMVVEDINLQVLLNLKVWMILKLYKVVICI